MAGPGLIYMNEQLYVKEDEIILKFGITGAGTQQVLPISNSAVLAFQTAAVPANQAAIDSFMGTATASEFLIAQFNSTCISTDTLGVLINMSGQKTGVTTLASNPNTNSAQAVAVLGFEASMFSSTNGLTTITAGTVQGTLASNSDTAGVQLGSCGNIGLRAVLTGLNNLTSGFIVIRIHWQSI